MTQPKGKVPLHIKFKEFQHPKGMILSNPHGSGRPS